MLTPLFPYKSSTLRLCWISYSERGDGTKPSHGESASSRNHLIKTWMTDQPTHRIHRMVKCSRMFPPRMALLNLHVVCWSLISIRARPLPHSPQATPVLAATLGLDDGSQTSTTEGARWDRIFVEHRHRSHGSCQGDLQCHTSQGCFRLGQHPPYNGQGTILVSYDWNSHA